MLTEYMSKINGSKTYVLAVVGGVVAIIGHFWGPTTLAGVTIPQISTTDMAKALWAVAGMASIRHGISTSKGEIK